MENDSNKNKIDDFLSGRLSEEERASFIKQIESDKSLEEELTLNYLEKEMAELIMEDHVNAYVQSLHKDNRASQAKRKTPRRWLMGLGLLLLATITVWFFFLTKPFNRTQEKISSPPSDSSSSIQPSALKTDSPAIKRLDDIVEEQKNKLSPSKFSDSKKANDNRALAMEYANNFGLKSELKELNSTKRGNNITKSDIDSLIAQEKYQEAASLLEKTNPEAASYPTDRYRLGICLFLNKDYEKAITVLEAFKSNQDNDYYYQMEYLLLLSYLAEGKSKEFLTLGAIIANPSHQSDYKTQAQDLISDWRSLNK